MPIEIQKPELEALIQERMKTGAFQTVEDVLIQALKSSPPGNQERISPNSSLVSIARVRLATRTSTGLSPAP